MNPPDWGYIGFGITVVGLGVVFWVADVGADYLIGPVLMLLGVLLMLFSLRPSLSSLFRRSKLRAEVLQVEVFLDYLPSVLSGSIVRKFALLRVRNTGTADLTVAARCSTMHEDEDFRCAWSTTSGLIFEGVGGATAELKAGEARLLVFAQAFPAERLWARLSSQGQVFEVAGQSGPTLGEVHFLSRDAEVLDVDGSMELKVSFHAQGLDKAHTVGVLLAFDGSKPTARRL